MRRDPTYYPPGEPISYVRWSTWAGQRRLLKDVAFVYEWFGPSLCTIRLGLKEYWLENYLLKKQVSRKERDWITTLGERKRPNALSYLVDPSPAVVLNNADVFDWITTNTFGQWAVTDRFSFESLDDATYFKLRWVG